MKRIKARTHVSTTETEKTFVFQNVYSTRSAPSFFPPHLYFVMLSTHNYCNLKIERRRVNKEIINYTEKTRGRQEIKKHK